MLEDPAVKKRFVGDGADSRPSASPEAIGTFIHAELKKWEKVIKTAGIKPE